MFLEYLKPVSKDLQDFAESCDNFCIGKKIRFSLDEKDTEQKTGTKIAVIGITDSRSASSDTLDDVDFSLVRSELYSLCSGNWHLPIYDLGDIVHCKEKEETGDVLKRVLANFIDRNFFLIILGGNSSFVYNQYRAYDDIKNNIGLVNFSSTIALFDTKEKCTELSYLNKIITDAPSNLLDYTHLGYQSYFVPYEHINLLDQLNFESVRLGVVVNELAEIEPYTRNIDVAMVDLKSIKFSDFKSTKEGKPDGFTSREICSIARYLGYSNSLSSLYISNYIEKYIKQDHILLSQMIWYVLEGRNHQQKENKNFEDFSSFERLIVSSDSEKYVFYKNKNTNQWWIEVDYVDESNEKYNHFIPCSRKDYEQVIEGGVPQRLWKYFKKFF